MSPTDPEYWVTLGLVLWKITRLVILPMVIIYATAWLAVVVLKKGGMIDL